MAIISDTVLGVNIKRIHNYATAAVLDELERHILHNVINPKEYDWAKLDYSVSGPLQSDNYSNPGFYPLKLISIDRKKELWISCVSCGYRGEGPTGCISALKLLGFHITEEDENNIFTTKEAHLEFKK